MHHIYVSIVPLCCEFWSLSITIDGCSGAVIKSKGFNDGVDDNVHTPPPFPSGKGSKSLLEKLEMRTRGEEEDEGSVHQDSDPESPSNSPTSVNSCDDSGTNFTGSSSSGSSSSGSSTGSAGCCSGNVTEDEDDEEGGGDDECLDDWEAMADALAADDKCQNPCSESPPVDEPVVQMVSPSEVIEELSTGALSSKPDSARLVSCPSGNTRAWRPDDAFRPQSLPNLSKQQSLPNRHRSFGGAVPWACTAAVASPCPICCEDLDLTDSSFLPCLCGFRLCLFCHKRILEEDGRCPGCRKPYECEPIETEASVHGGSLTLRLTRSCSMIERS